MGKSRKLVAAIGATLFAVTSVSAVAQDSSGWRLWVEPAAEPFDEVLFPFPFTWPHDTVGDPSIVNVGGWADDAVTYGIPTPQGGLALCMRVGEMNPDHYSRVFQEGDFACFLDGYRFDSAQQINAYITHRRAGGRLAVTGYRRTRNGYEPLYEMLVLRPIF